MNLRRLRQWFAWPDAVRSSWKRRLVWCAPLTVVVAGVTMWRGCAPPLPDDVTLVSVSREEAAVIVDEIRKERSGRAFGALWRGQFRDFYELLRPVPVTNVALGWWTEHDTEKNLAKIETKWGLNIFYGRTNGVWRFSFVGKPVKKQ
jgi:hypothetical protein